MIQTREETKMGTESDFQKKQQEWKEKFNAYNKVFNEYLELKVNLTKARDESEVGTQKWKNADYNISVCERMETGFHTGLRFDDLDHETYEKSVRAVLDDIKSELL